MAELRDTASVKGLSQVGEALKNLPLEIKEKVARKATLEAAKIGLAAAQSETPIRTGLTFKYERITRHKNVPYNIVEYVVFIKSRGKKGQEYPYYWVFVEFGTSKMAANPFMLRGFLKSAPNAATRARDIAGYVLAKEVAKR